jgi:hypothetical protein
MREPVEYRLPVRSQLGLVKTAGSRATRFANMPMGACEAGGGRWAYPGLPDWVTNISSIKATL